MSLRSHCTSVLAIVAAMVPLTACPPPRVMIVDTFVGDNKIAKSYLVQRGDDQKLFDFSVRVCSVSGDKAQKVEDCRDSLIVDRVVH